MKIKWVVSFKSVKVVLWVMVLVRSATIDSLEGSRAAIIGLVSEAQVMLEWVIIVQGIQLFEVLSDDNNSGLREAVM